MNPDAPRTVAVGTLTTSLVGGLFAGARGALGRTPLPTGGAALTGRGALSAGIAGAAFFAVREYAVSPALVTLVDAGQYPRRRRALQRALGAQDVGLAEDDDVRSFADMRTERMPDSMLAGALAGAVLNAWRRGVKGAFPGLWTGALACGALQLLGNELAVTRVKYVARRAGFDFPSSAPDLASTEDPVRPLSERVLDRLGLFVRIPDDEYLARMKAKRAHFLRQIAVLEEVVAAEKRAREETPRQEDRYS